MDERDETTDAYAVFAAELGRMGRHLDGMAAHLLTLRQLETGQPQTGQPQTGQLETGRLDGGAGPAAPVRVPTGTRPGPGQPPGLLPPPVTWPPPVWPPPAAWPPPVGSTPAALPPAPPGQRPTSSALTGARLLAWAGGAVTLLGVVLLLAFAASRGWFTPALRVAGGGLLGVALVGIGLRLHRLESTRSGAGALAATGFATLYLTVAAATSVEHYLPAPVALLCALAVAGAGLGVADHWRSELLAGAVTVGAAVLAPVLAGGWLLVALVSALQLAGLAVVRRRAWSVLLLLAAAAPALYGVFVVVDEQRPGVVVGLAAATVAIGLGAVLVASTSRPGPRAVVLIGAALPGLIGAGALGGVAGTVTVVALAALLGGFAFLPGLPTPVRVAAGVTAVVALQVAVATGLHGPGPTTIALLGEALVAAALAVVRRSRFAVVTGLALGAVGLLAALDRDALLATVWRFGSPVDDGIADVGVLVTGAVVSTLILAVAAVLLKATGRRGWTRPDAASAAVWVPLGLAGLYGAAGLVMGLALLVSPTPDGFRGGHVAITVSWTVAALVLLAQGLRRPALRITGLVLVAAALTKLVLFDLVALDGLARVVAFLGAGLVLLAAGTRYARMVAEVEESRALHPGVAAAPDAQAPQARPTPGPPPTG